MGLEEIAQGVEIGRGRSGRVFRSRDKDGNDIAIKVVTEGDLLTILANYFFTGAPNAYNWNEDAILSAHYRRPILKELVSYWTDSKVRVANSLGARWNDEFKAYELLTEFVDGRHASLHHPFSKQKETELSDLVNNVMKPLQQKLIESGFDGLVWQAGKGIPVASANFMLEQNEDNHGWVWVDLESGVPAMAPLDPVSFFSFYLPKSIKHKRPLFDDADIGKLRAYISTHREDLESKIDTRRYNSLLDNINHLEFHQKEWKSMRRAHRSITYQLKKGRISQGHANWYFEHPDVWHDAIWYGRETARLSWKAYSWLIADIPYEIDLRLTLFDYKKAASNVWRFISSEKYRSEVAKNYVHDRINVWEQRKKLEHEEADYLRAFLETEATSGYLADLFVHGAFKVIDWSILGIAAGLYTFGVTDSKESIGLGLWGSPIMRTAYTTSRMAYSMGKPKNLKRMPSNIKQFVIDTNHAVDSDGYWKGLKYAAGRILGIERLIALGIGWIPQIGNAAYPVQMLYSESTEDREIGKFVLYDSFSRIGQKIPVYGGRDTLTEHFFNHRPDLIVRNRNGLNFPYET